jgi:hypothetical protein
MPFNKIKQDKMAQVFIVRDGVTGRGEFRGYQNNGLPRNTTKLQYKI